MVLLGKKIYEDGFPPSDLLSAKRVKNAIYKLKTPLYNEKAELYLE